MPIRIAIVDDQRLFRDGLQMILDGHDDLEVVFQAKHGRQLFERMAFEPVDVVLLDVEMPDMDGTETLTRLRADHPEVRVLMLTMHDSERLINHLMQLGANGFLLKDEDAEVVCRAVRTVVDDGMFFRDYVSKALLKGARAKVKSTDPFAPKLSERELEIIRLICAEKTSKEIAEQLFISARTVEGHRRNIQDKIGAKNIAGIVLYAARQGLV